MTYQQLLKQTQSLSLEDQQRLMIFLYKKFGSTRKHKQKTKPPQRKQTSTHSLSKVFEEWKNSLPSDLTFQEDEFYQ